MNSRLDEIQAAILRVKLKYLDEDTEKRRAVAEQYLSAITHPQLVLPHVAIYGTHAWHLFVVRLKERDALAAHLQQAGIQTMIHYPIPPHHQQAYPELSDHVLPLTEAIHREVLSLPISPVMDVASIALVVDAVEKFSC